MEHQTERTEQAAAVLSEVVEPKKGSAPLIYGLSLLGVLDQNEQLPSVRALAREIGVNPNTVAKAYQELERQGIIYTVPGRGSFVSPDVLRLEGPKREALQEVFAACDRAVERGVNPPELLAEIERHLSNPSQGGNGHD